MIKINLLGEKKASKPARKSRFQIEGLAGGRNLILAVILILGFVVAIGWSWSVSSELKDLHKAHREADAELVRLQEIIKKGDEYKRQKDLLERKIQLITDLKKKQAVPVHILDQVSKNLPDFLWLDSMSVKNNKISISGKATTYTAVSNFYQNLASSGYFADVDLGRTFEGSGTVSFSLTCRFAPAEKAPEKAGNKSESRG